LWVGARLIALCKLRVRNQLGGWVTITPQERGRMKEVIGLPSPDGEL